MDILTQEKFKKYSHIAINKDILCKIWNMTCNNLICSLTLEWKSSFQHIFLPLSTEPYRRESDLSPWRMPGKTLCNGMYKSNWGPARDQFKQAKIDIVIMNKSFQVCAQICPNTTRFSKHKQKLLVINNRSCNKCYCKKYLPTSPSIKLILISFFFFYKCLYPFLSIRMSIELAATEDVTKTLCERESRKQENTSMKEKAIPVF